MQTFRYLAYQLSIEFPFCCPELPASTGEPDILVTFGAVPDSLPAPRKVGGIFEARPNQFLLKLDGIARYWVQNGDQIVISPDPDAATEDVRLFLLSTCLTVILLQRGGVLTLHASAFDTTHGAVLLIGYSGVGKSTLLSVFLKRGHTMISDDVAPVWLNKEGRVMSR